MSDIQVYRTSRSTPVTLPAPVAIHDGVHPERPAAKPAGAYGETSGGSPSRNGRTAQAPPHGRLEVSWERTVADAPQEIKSLLAAAARIYVGGSMTWKLLDAGSGKVVAQGIRGLGEPVLDGALSLLYQPDKNGQLDGLHFDAGQKVFWSPLHLNADLLRKFTARVGDSLFLFGSERWQPGHDNFEPSLTVLEALPVRPAPEVRPSGQLNPGGAKPLLWKSVNWTAAAWPQGIAIAFPGQIHLVDESLEILRVLTGSFDAVALSVDEEGYLHLIVDEPGKPRALWIVAPDGVRTLRLPLPKPYDQASTPPLILHGRQVIVQAPAGLFCVGADGVTHWARTLAVGSGAVVLSDDTLLATDGHDLVTFDREGQRAVLHHFPEHALIGPPIPGDAGEITVATKTQVLRLTPRK